MVTRAPALGKLLLTPTLILQSRLWSVVIQAPRRHALATKLTSGLLQSQDVESKKVATAGATVVRQPKEGSKMMNTVVVPAAVGGMLATHPRETGHCINTDHVRGPTIPSGTRELSR
jgi:hypothetical protein